MGHHSQTAREKLDDSGPRDNGDDLLLRKRHSSGERNEAIGEAMMHADVETDTVAEPFYISTGHLPTPDPVTASESRIPDVGDDHPVVHVAYTDALAYAKWPARTCRPKRSGSFAARGGLDGAEFAWGDELAPGGKHMANTWQGPFPHEKRKLDGYERTSPVTAFPPNLYGVYDMIGNVWEWTTDWHSPKHEADAPKACCIPENPRGGREDASYDPCLPDIKIPRKVLKGGSHRFAPNYCRRYRPAARHPEPVDTSTSHVGFRCIVRRAGASR